MLILQLWHIIVRIQVEATLCLQLRQEWNFTVFRPRSENVHILLIFILNLLVTLFHKMHLVIFQAKVNRY